MQTVLALPVQQARKMSFSPAAAMPASPNSPTPPLSSATSPSTSSTLSDNASCAFNANLDAHINSNPALKIALPFDEAAFESTRMSKSKRTARREAGAPFQYTFPTFPPTLDLAEQKQRPTMARTTPLQLQLASNALVHVKSEFQCSIPDAILQMQDLSTESGGPGPERRPKSKLARLFNEYPQLAHPYARLSQKDKDVKRRRIWGHTLEKSIFTPEEISTVNAPKRRQPYIASLEANIDRIHDKLHDSGGWYPVPRGDIDIYTGLNHKTAKSMVCGLQSDAIICNLKLLELKRINKSLEEMLTKDNPFDSLPPSEPSGAEFM